MFSLMRFTVAQRRKERSVIPNAVVVVANDALPALGRGVVGNQFSDIFKMLANLIDGTPVPVSNCVKAPRLRFYDVILKQSIISLNRDHFTSENLIQNLRIRMR